MLELTVNGEKARLEEACPLDQALKKLGFEGGHFAVALNGEFVPRSTYRHCEIQGGESLEVLSPMQGG